LYISTHISLVFLSLGSAEADTGQGEKLNGHLMASCFGNICTKNYDNLIIYVHVKIKNIRNFFLRHSEASSSMSAYRGEIQS